MPGILETPEAPETASEISWQTFMEECAVQPSSKVTPIPKRSRFATFFQKLCFSSVKETRSHYSQPAELRSLDMLARDHPYLFTRLVCN